MTYAELAAFVARFTRRTDLGDDLPTFIAMAEEEMNVLRVRQMIKRVTATISGEYSALPTDFLAERTIQIGDYEVEYVTPEALDALFDLTPDRPTKYTIIAGEFRFAPVPDQSYAIELTYYAKPVPFTESTSNFLSDDFGSVYRFGCLWAAGMLTEDDKAIARYRGELDRAIGSIQDRFKDKIGRTLKVEQSLIEVAQYGARHRYY